MNRSRYVEYVEHHTVACYLTALDFRLSAGGWEVRQTAAEAGPGPWSPVYAWLVWQRMDPWNTWGFRATGAGGRLGAEEVPVTATSSRSRSDEIALGGAR